MRLLLDTHAFLWWLDGDRRLPAKVRRLIAGTRNEIFVSAASAWEICTKARLGKLPGALEVASDVSGCIADQGFVGLPITVRHAERSGSFGDQHRDPFDRMLAAQSTLEELPVVTADPAFDTLGVRCIW